VAVHCILSTPASPRVTFDLKDSGTRDLEQPAWSTTKLMGKVSTALPAPSDWEVLEGTPQLAALLRLGGSSFRASLIHIGDAQKVLDLLD